jgi:hypothetical protein
MTGAEKDNEQLSCLRNAMNETDCFIRDEQESYLFFSLNEYIVIRPCIALQGRVCLYFFELRER